MTIVISDDSIVSVVDAKAVRVHQHLFGSINSMLGLNSGIDQQRTYWGISPSGPAAGAPSASSSSIMIVAVDWIPEPAAILSRSTPRLVCRESTQPLLQPSSPCKRAFGLAFGNRQRAAELTA